MLTRMRRLIAPPMFAGDEEKTQAAEVLNAVLLTMLAACVLYGVVAPRATAIYLRRLGIAGPLVLWLLGMLSLMRRGYLRFASSATIAGTWVILTLTAATDGGVRSLAFGGYMIVVLGAGLLLGLRPAIGVAVASPAAGLALLYAVRAGVLPTSAADRPDTLIWLVQSIYLLVAAALLGRAIRTIDRALERARRELGACRQAEVAFRQSEVLLRESERRYHTLVEKMSEGLIQVDNDDVIQFVNDSYCEMTGYIRAELIGKRAAQVMLISEEDCRMAREKNRLRKQGSADRYEIQLRKKSGEVIWVVMNLAINARDAMPNGGTLIVETANAALDDDYAREHVDVRAGPYVMLAISDTGSGMDAATYARIFESFFTTKAQGKGTGLGLATVHGIVNQSGGHIWVYSEPGHGSTFKVYLPRAAAPVEAPVPAHAPAALPHGSATILLVEDERVVRELASRILRRQGYRMLEAADGQTALRIADDHSEAIDLLLTDVIMPGGFSGRQLAEQLVLRRQDLKVLYMSGYTDDAITHYGMLDADIAYLQKPFTPDALIRKVQEVLEV